MTRIFGTKYPIVAGTMMNVSTPEFTAACSNAGILGTLHSVMHPKPDLLRAAIARVRELTDQPFAVNINLFPMLQPPNNSKLVRVAVEEGVPVIETSGHKAPTRLVPKIKQGGALWMHKCAGVRYAKTAEKLGADVVEVVGWENGGATGRFDVGTLVLIPAVADAVDVPVVAGGGIADGRGVAAAFCLGASGVLIGTRLMATEECPIHENVKRAWVDASIYDTTLVMRSLGATHRVWHNSAADRVLELEASGAGEAEIFDAAAGRRARKVYEEGDLQAGISSCGQAVGLVRDVVPVAQLVERMVTEAKEVLKRLA